MKIKVTEATRNQKKLRMLLDGVYGSGKTYTSLLIANGLLSHLPLDERKKKILLFDTEARRASLKASAKFSFDVIDYDEAEQGRPVSAQDYVEVIEYAESNGYEVLILDSTTPEWDYVLAEHNKMSGNSYANWGKVKSKYHDPFVQKVIHCKVHILATARAKVVNALNEKSQRNKVGLDIKQQDEFPYFMDFVFHLDTDHTATVEKQEEDNEGKPLFGNASFKPSMKTGEILAEWLASAEDPEVLRYKRGIATVLDRYKTVKGIPHELATVELKGKSIEELAEIGKAIKASLDDSVPE